MSSTDRVKNIQVYRPIVYGNQARLLTEEEKKNATPGHTHKWTIFLASATSAPPKSDSTGEGIPLELDELAGGGDDLTYMIKKVIFRLHETYPTPNRVLDKPPFQVSETGWGEFPLQIKIQFVQESGEKPLTLTHMLKLHHWGAPIEGPPPKPTGENAQAGPSSTSTPAVTTNNTPKPDASTPAEGVKDESATPAGGQSGEKKDGEGEAMDIDGESKPATTTHGTNGESTATPAEPQTVSVAAKYPVLAWQYDELVFSDPTTTFMNILNANPPTPLPPKSRRARNIRELYDATPGAKAKKAKTRTSLAAEGSAGGAAGEGEQGKEEPKVRVGLSGEPDSADVPLEFSKDMEKTEWNVLNDARVKIVEMMDQYRERLIAKEKDLAKVKEELAAM